MSIFKIRKDAGAVCPKCKSPDYKYDGRTEAPEGKHCFKCNSCDRTWQYGKTESIYTELA